MRCSKCGAENPDRAKFCGECASPFTRRCPSCETENSLIAKFGGSRSKTREVNRSALQPRIRRYGKLRGPRTPPSRASVRSSQHYSRTSKARLNC